MLLQAAIAMVSLFGASVPEQGEMLDLETEQSLLQQDQQSEDVVYEEECQDEMDSQEIVFDNEDQVTEEIASFEEE